MSVEIRKHQMGKDVGDFIRAAHVVHAGDPCFVPPLDFMIREQLNPKKNPFFQHAEGVLFTAWKDGKLAGRVSAQIDQEHLKRYNDLTGYFGFFDTIEDVGVAQALIDAAGAWLREQGMKRMRGPLSLSINEEVGILVDGFDTPPMIAMTHSRPYQGSLAEACGLQKAMDVLAWRYQVDTVPPRAQAAYDQITQLPEVKIRNIDKKNLAAELKWVLEIQDDAWRENWGHVSLTMAEADYVVSSLAMLIDFRLGVIAEIDGKPAGMCIALPNLNEVIADLDGKLLPLGWAKLLYRLKVKGTKTARLALLGIKREYRGVKRYGGLSLALITQIAKNGREAGIEWGELSWTLEDNVAVNLQIKVFRGEKYKRYRMYEKAL
jgi:hypothetical protein